MPCRTSPAFGRGRRSRSRTCRRCGPDLRRTAPTTGSSTAPERPRANRSSQTILTWAWACRRSGTLAHLDCPEFRAIGATLPGVVGIILGRNDRIAWGFTNLNADVQDLYVEKLATGDPNSYVTPDGPRPLAIRPEVVHVRDADDLSFDARETIHGPVISDVSPRAGRRGRIESPDLIGLDGPAGRRHDGPRDPAHEPRQELGRVHRRPQRFQGSAAKYRLRGCRRQHRLLRGRTCARPPTHERRPGNHARARLGRHLRMDGLHPVRRDAASLQPGRRIDRYGQP